MMDLSSSAPHRTKTAETLAIQPGSIRTPAMDAANEFARHLAENSHTDAAPRRDDRPVERRERHETRERTSRDEKAETRAAAREARDPSQDKAEDTDAPEAVAQLGATPDEATTLIDPLAVQPDDALIAEDAAAMDTTLPAEEVEGSASAIAPSSGTVEAEFDAQTETAAAPAAAPASPVSPAAAPSEAKPADTGNAPQMEIAKTTTPAGGAAQPTDATTPDEAVSTKSASVAPKSMTPATGQPTGDENIVAGTSSDSAAEIQAVMGAKPGKGLGHAAADQLADKKADAKQVAAQANAAPQAVPSNQQNQRPAGATPPPAQATTETSGAARSGDLLTTSTTPASGTNGNAATVRIGTVPGQAQPTQLPSTAIALQMARNLQKGISRFDIRLDPPEMGRIDIRMEVRKDGQVAAHMTVDRPETLDLLQRDARALQQALNNAGLQADSDSLNFSLRDQSSESDRRDFASGERGAGNPDMPVEEPVLSPTYNVNLSANGGVDIRV